MFRQLMQKLLSVMLLVVCPSALSAGERPGAMLYAKGTVTLNGEPVARYISVFDGDRVETSSNSVVSINRSGSSLVADPNSSLQYRNDGFDVRKGTVHMRILNGMTTRVGPLSVIPKQERALYDVSSDGNTVLVASREGVLTLTDGVETANLEPGYTAKVTVVDTQEYQDQGPKPAAGTRGETVHHKKKVLIVILVSAAAAGAIACILVCGNTGGFATTPVLP